MALCRTITCKECGQEKRVWFGGGEITPEVCNECDGKQAEAEKQTYLDTLAKLPTKERLRRIEEWMYNHSKGHPQRPIRF